MSDFCKTFFLTVKQNNEMFNSEAQNIITEKIYERANIIPTQITSLDGLVILSSAFFAGLLIRYIFRKYSNSFSSQNAYGNTILMITISVAALIAVVKSSLALSLGLVGALSVVRFRTAVKEPYNLAFLLFAICIGISIGASQYSFALLIFIFGSLAVIIAYKRMTKANNNKHAIQNFDTLSINFNSNSDFESLYRILEQNSESFLIKTLDRSFNGNTTIIVDILIIENNNLNKIINELENNFKDIHITFYNSPSS